MARSAPTCSRRRCSRAPSFRARSGSNVTAVAGVSGARRIGDHCREVGFGGELPVDARAPRELAHGGALLDELDIELKEDARLDRLAELRAFNRHEIDQLAGVREAK